MLLQLIVQHPQALGKILQNTPTWVWGLLAGLLALGISQLRQRQASLARIVVMPAAMTLFAVWGMVSAFGVGAAFAWVLLAWAAAAIAVGALVGMGAAANGTRYDAATRIYELPGSAMPLLLIVGIFLTKYAVGVELAMQPRLAADPGFAVSIAALYGVFTGVFAGRAWRLLRLAVRPAAPSLANA